MFWTNYTFVRWNLAWCTGCQDRRPLHVLRLLVPLSDEVPDSARLSNLKHSLQRVSIRSMAQTIHFIHPAGSGSPSSTVQVATWWNSTEDFSIRATPCPLLEGPIFSTDQIHQRFTCKSDIRTGSFRPKWLPWLPRVLALGGIDSGLELKPSMQLNSDWLSCTSGEVS